MSLFIPNGESGNSMSVSTPQAYVGATLIDGLGHDPIEKSVLVIENGVIVAIGQAGSVTIPENARKIDVDGLTLLPGIIDCHTHLGGASTTDYSDWVLENNTRQAMVSTVQMTELMKSGVTTIRDISRNGLHLKWAVNADILKGPRIISCGPGISRTGGHGDAHNLPHEIVTRDHPWATLADGPEELRKTVRILSRMGSDAVKIWATGGGMWDKELETDQHFDLEELKMVVNEAALLGMPVLAHAESLGGAKDAIRAGVATIEHGEELDDECREMMLSKNIIHVPTLQLFLGPWFDNYPPPPRVGLENYRGETMIEKEKNRVMDNFNASRLAGVTIAVGSDSFSSKDVPYGESTLEEIRTMVRTGMPPMDALVAGTSNGAKALRVTSVTGSLGIGKAGDMILLEGDPLINIELLRGENMRFIARGTQVWKDEITNSHN